MPKPQARRLTFASVKSQLAQVGFKITQFDGEYRVVAKGGSEAAAYYTYDLDDALNTGLHVARNAARGGLA